MVSIVLIAFSIFYKSSCVVLLVNLIN